MLQNILNALAMTLLTMTLIPAGGLVVAMVTDSDRVAKWCFVSMCWTLLLALGCGMSSCVWESWSTLGT
jgi:hypothetical protein